MDAEIEERTDSNPGQSKAVVLTLALILVLKISLDHLPLPVALLAVGLLVYVPGYWIPPRDPNGFWPHAVGVVGLWGVGIPLWFGPSMLRALPVYLAYGVPCLLAFLMVFFAMKHLARKITPLQRSLTVLVWVTFLSWAIF